jgi:hypothetical protein
MPQRAKPPISAWPLMPRTRSRQEGVDSRLRRLGDEMAEARQGHARRAALVDHCGDARLHADQVGVHAEASADVTIDVSVRVDHARQHQPSTDVHDLLGAGRQDVLLDRGDLAVADRDVHHAVDLGCGANDVPATKQQVIGLIVGHGCSPSLEARLR